MVPMTRVDISQYSTSYKPRSICKRVSWYIINTIFFKSNIPYPYAFKVRLLKLFGAKIGKNIVIKPSVNVKHPWLLEIGDDCWIGEGVWIDNVAKVKIGKSVVLSQGAYLLSANHNYKSQFFDLMLEEIVIEDGVWIAAKSIVALGVTCKTHSVLAMGSIATGDLDAYGIYQGNPATKKRERVVSAI